MPFGAVWDEYCRRQNVPADSDVWAEVKKYEDEVMYQR